MSDGSTDGTDEYLASGAAPLPVVALQPAQRRTGGGPQPRRRGGPRRPRRCSSTTTSCPRPTSSPPTSAATSDRRRRPRRDRPDDHAADAAISPWVQLGAGHALQAVRRDGARRLRGDGAAVLHRQRVDRPPPPRSTPAASTRRSAGRGRRARLPAGRPRAALRVRARGRRAALRRAQLRRLARRRLRLRAQRRHLRPRPRPAVAARRDRPRVPRPPPLVRGSLVAVPAPTATAARVAMPRARRDRPLGRAPLRARRASPRRRSAPSTTCRTTGGWPTSSAIRRRLLARFDGGRSRRALAARRVRPRADARPHHPRRQPAHARRAPTRRSTPCSSRSSSRSTGSAARVPGFGNWTVRAGLRARRAIRRLRRGGPLDALFIHTQVPAILSPDQCAGSRRSSRSTPRRSSTTSSALTTATTPASERVEQLKWRANRPASPAPRAIVTWAAVDQGRPRRPLRGRRRQDRRHPAGRRLRAVGSRRRRRDRRRRRRSDARPVRRRRLRAQGRRRAARCGPPSCAPTASTSSSTSSPATPSRPTTASRVHHGLGPNSPELISLYHQADVFCLPTLGDCLPMVLSEAGAVGLPLVSTDVGAISEIVRDGRTGLLVPVGDAAALAAALRRLCDRPGAAPAARRRGPAGRASRVRRGDQRPPARRPARRRRRRRRPDMSGATGAAHGVGHDPGRRRRGRSPPGGARAPTTSRWPAAFDAELLDYAGARRETGRLGRLRRPPRRRQRRARLGLLPAAQAHERDLHRRRAGRPAVRRAARGSPAAGRAT